MDAEAIKLKSDILTLIKKNNGYLRVKISPNAPVSKFKEILQDEFQTIKIAIKAAPEKGRANKEVLRFLQHELAKDSEQAPKPELLIVSGHTSQIKLIRIT